VVNAQTGLIAGFTVQLLVVLLLLGLSTGTCSCSQDCRSRNWLWDEAAAVCHIMCHIVCVLSTCSQVQGVNLYMQAAC